MIDYQKFLDDVDKKTCHAGEFQREEDGYTVICKICKVKDGDTLPGEQITRQGGFGRRYTRGEKYLVGNYVPIEL